MKKTVKRIYYTVTLDCGFTISSSMPEYCDFVVYGEAVAAVAYKKEHGVKPTYKTFTVEVTGRDKYARIYGRDLKGVYERTLS